MSFWLQEDEDSRRAHVFLLLFFFFRVRCFLAALYFRVFLRGVFVSFFVCYFYLFLCEAEQCPLFFYSGASLLQAVKIPEMSTLFSAISSVRGVPAFFRSSAADFQLAMRSAALEREEFFFRWRFLEPQRRL